eukprot:2957649-Amphidinium_carterae.1
MQEQVETSGGTARFQERARSQVRIEVSLVYTSCICVGFSMQEFGELTPFPDGALDHTIEPMS